MPSLWSQGSGIAKAARYLGWSPPWIAIWLSIIFFSGQYFLCRSNDIRRIQPIFYHQLRRGTALTKGVIGTYIFDRCRKMPGYRLCNGVTQATDNIVLFGSDGTTGLLYGFQNSGRIQRLDGVEIDHLNRHAFFLQDLSGFDGLPHQVPAGKDRYIRSFGQDLGLTDLGRQLIREDRPHGPAKTKINGSHIVGDGDGRCLR